MRTLRGEFASLPLPEPVAAWDGFTHIGWPASALMLQSSMSISTSLSVIMNAYTWSRAQEALSQAVGLDPDPFDDTLLEYQNPLTGGPTLLTIGTAIQTLRPGAKCKPHRRTIHFWRNRDSLARFCSLLLVRLVRSTSTNVGFRG